MRLTIFFFGICLIFPVFLRSRYVTDVVVSLSVLAALGSTRVQFTHRFAMDPCPSVRRPSPTMRAFWWSFAMQ
jgi:hypothetical protein